MSESDKSHLGTVIKRWDTIIQHLQSFARYYSDLDTFMVPEGGFSKRNERQIAFVHVAAYCLTPTNRALLSELQQNQDYREQLFTFFSEYTNSSEESKQLQREYVYYTTQKRMFGAEEPFWEHQEDPREFWLFASLSSKYFAPLCCRLFNTPCNSVPSERAFSIQNLIHSKVRNSLKSEKVDKLTFIYMNSRVLKTTSTSSGLTVLPKSSPYDLSEEQLVQMEEVLLEDEEQREEDEIDVDSDDSWGIITLYTTFSTGTISSWSHLGVTMASTQSYTTSTFRLFS